MVHSCRVEGRTRLVIEAKRDADSSEERTTVTERSYEEENDAPFTLTVILLLDVIRLMCCCW